MNLKIDRFKNLRGCEIKFEQSSFLTAVIGGNGSGKSNLIEAILHILLGVYLRKPPKFRFEFEFEAQGRHVRLRGDGRSLDTAVDGETIPTAHFAERLRGGPAQVYFPELTFVYYSGDCRRVRRLIQRYRRSFQSITRNASADGFRPLFVESSEEQAKLILLALLAHGHDSLLRRLRVTGVTDIVLSLRSPEGFDSDLHEPKLWNTVGAVRRILSAIDDTADAQDTERQPATSVHTSGELERDQAETARYKESRTYTFTEGGASQHSVFRLADRLDRSGDNLYVACQHLAARGILRSVKYRLRGPDHLESFDVDHLSEGEKQLLAVIGALRLTNQRDNLVLLDEPDTHLNPQWSWEYQELLAEAFSGEQSSRSSVILTTHDPVMISGLTSDQVLVARAPSEHRSEFTSPHRNPRGQGVANLLCSSEFFGLPSSLDKVTQRLLDERLRISMKEALDPRDRERLDELSRQLEILPGVSERDPKYVAFLRQQLPGHQD